MSNPSYNPFRMLKLNLSAMNIEPENQNLINALLTDFMNAMIAHCGERLNCSDMADRTPIDHQHLRSIGMEVDGITFNNMMILTTEFLIVLNAMQGQFLAAGATVFGDYEEIERAAVSNFASGPVSGIEQYVEYLSTEKASLFDSDELVLRLLSDFLNVVREYRQECILEIQDKKNDQT